jgi:hypothetical protein
MFECNETLSICVVSLVASLGAIVSVVKLHLTFENEKKEKQE